MSDKHDADTIEDMANLFWEDTFQSALSGILANPDVKVSAINANIDRAYLYADQASALYRKRLQGEG